MKQQIIKILASTDFLTRDGKESATDRIIEVVDREAKIDPERQEQIRVLVDTLRKVEAGEEMPPRFISDVKHALLEVLDEAKGGVPSHPGSYFDPPPARVIAKNLCVDDLLSLAASDAPERLATEEASASEIRREIKAISDYMMDSDLG